MFFLLIGLIPLVDNIAHVGKKQSIYFFIVFNFQISLFVLGGFITGFGVSLLLLRKLETPTSPTLIGGFILKTRTKYFNYRLKLIGFVILCFVFIGGIYYIQTVGMRDLTKEPAEPTKLQKILCYVFLSLHC